MINALRMLKAALTAHLYLRGGGRRRPGESTLSRAAQCGLDLGVLGLAIAGVEHVTQRSGVGGTTPSSGASRPLSSAAPPPPLTPVPGKSSARKSSAPPPLPAPPPTEGTATDDTHAEAMLLIRAMIAAAHADHHLDDDERQRVLEAVGASGLGDEECQVLHRELERPLALESLASEASSRELARQVYLASFIAIEVDERAEVNYLARLAECLKLDDSEVKELEELRPAEEP